MKRILVIKLSALGDVVLALGPFEAIRRHHAADHVTLLTTAPYADLARASRYFDDVWVDARPRPLDVAGWWALRRRLRAGRFDRVYDLQTSDRSGVYYRLLARPKPEWSGIARGCSHPHANPKRDRLHTLERQAEQLRMAGIPKVAPAELSWLDGDIGRFGLRPPFVLFVPGGAPHRPEKRWPAGSYAELGRRLSQRGLCPVLIGAEPERALLSEIARGCPAARDVCGLTSLAEIAGLARRAEGAVGNDTGPVHLIAAVGCPVLVLFSSASDPALSRPRGERVALLRVPDLGQLPVAEVERALKPKEIPEAASLP
ncbi:MAG TPA: glycosyltransferase family 9 protein [Alphaproteobacteria bacterium]|nr:glycosyltransferase family 9 protein [Alphaproteobacteria bacterium]